jgi:hypothetical protein
MTSTNPTGPARETALERLNAQGIRHQFPTADAVINPGATMFIVTDPDPSDTDWLAVCDLISRVGYSNGTWPYSTDPGEPQWDAVTGTCTWTLPLTAPVWASQPTGPEPN